MVTVEMNGLYAMRQNHVNDHAKRDGVFRDAIDACPEELRNLYYLHSRQTQTFSHDWMDADREYLCPESKDLGQPLQIDLGAPQHGGHGHEQYSTLTHSGALSIFMLRSTYLFKHAVH